VGAVTAVRVMVKPLKGSCNRVAAMSVYVVVLLIADHPTGLMSSHNAIILDSNSTLTSI
jgi:hypothetical protein